ncbi:MAG: glucose 1-dehydrogenase [Microthrixaceae bacterium]|jgi:NAD(P)-dependent dehydrogenase (short-subunit alcohol dehydrogenase family)|nr:glucose 1-dehydrogenase [Microthrixaceae bacterium]MCB9402227.1 glucose 1-dehydrogenase [Microthrixaceae bacterium]RUP36121.1 MAG: glucose 1-dehydrogenase [Gordonia sp. (in: high G+C Gram-positive bacteria)]
MQQLFGLDGRVAVVTGASSGLGDRFARVLHGAGATVVVAARRAERLEALAADLGGRVVVVPADLTVAADRERLIEEAFDVAGRIDVLVNNAGYGVPSPAESESIDRFEQTMDINVTAPFHLAQLAGRHMLAAGSGSIVNIASVLGLAASAPIKEVSYCASKGAVVNLTRQLGCEWGRKGVRVNAIAPGWFPSEMTQAEMFDDEGGQSFIVRNTPMGRAGELAELDGALLYLAGDASTYVTGHILAVDGGWLAR